MAKKQTVREKKAEKAQMDALADEFIREVKGEVTVAHEEPFQANARKARAPETKAAGSSRPTPSPARAASPVKGVVEMPRVTPGRAVTSAMNLEARAACVGPYADSATRQLYMQRRDGRWSGSLRAAAASTVAATGCPPVQMWPADVRDAFWKSFFGNLDDHDRMLRIARWQCACSHISTSVGVFKQFVRDSALLALAESMAGACPGVAPTETPVKALERRIAARAADDAAVGAGLTRTGHRISMADDGIVTGTPVADDELEALRRLNDIDLEAGDAEAV